MKRLVLAIACGCFLLSTAGTFLHRHEDGAPHPDCGLCLAAAQTPRHAAFDLPALSAPMSWTILGAPVQAAAAAAPASRPDSRGPPAA